MCPLSDSSMYSAAGWRSAISRLCSTGVIRSSRPPMTSVSTPRSASSAWYLSCVANPGKKSATTSNGVPASISATNSTRVRDTLEPKE